MSVASSLDFAGLGHKIDSRMRAQFNLGRLAAQLWTSIYRLQPAYLPGPVSLSPPLQLLINLFSFLIPVILSC